MVITGRSRKPLGRKPTWVRIPPAAPNKHRDFDTKSRCSFFVSKPKNIRVFKVSRLKPSPAELFSTGDFVLFIEVDAHPYKSQRGFYGDNVSIMGANVGFVGLTCI